jgi:hypothetical protein
MSDPRQAHEHYAGLSELSGRTLLVVEDDDDVVDMLATLLGRYGVHLVRTHTVADARAVADAVYVDTAPSRVGQPRPARRAVISTCTPLMDRCVGGGAD